MARIGATTRASPAKVCATPIVVPSSDFWAACDISDVVAGNSSAVPIGTSGMIERQGPEARHRGIQQQPER